ncbi:MAG: hypothetical protein OEV42_20470 [Deltaproteobacteria bacterium]|nr:hypothetical protein [Deltaproteobacteria bacterium]
MNRKVIISIIFLLVCIASPLNASEIINGTYIGWKKIGDLSPHDKSEVWYHEHKLTIKGGAATISASPRTIKNGKLFYSASDGGFFKYEGKIIFGANQPEIVIKVVDCDYCGKPVGGWKEKKYPITIEDEVSFIFNSVRYMLQKSE